MKVRSPYTRVRTPFETTGESLTHQSMAPECDINRIMAKWQKTGVIEHANTYQGDYGDFSETPTYQEAMNVVLETTDMFMTLPSSVRRQFDNDPGEFLTFAVDPANGEKMIEMGLATPSVVDHHDTPPEAPKTAKKAAPEPESEG
ncbi:internal scaffolding protein [Microviridae sp.]|nr:internal scaffolding protein [Microviridae sp.]